MNKYSLHSITQSSHEESAPSQNEKIYFLKEEKRKLAELKLKLKLDSETKKCEDKKAA